MYLVKIKNMLNYDKARLGECMNKFQLALSRIFHLVAVQPKQETNKFWSYTCLDFVRLL